MARLVARLAASYRLVIQLLTLKRDMGQMEGPFAKPTGAKFGRDQGAAIASVPKNPDACNMGWNCSGIPSEWLICSAIRKKCIRAIMDAKSRLFVHCACPWKGAGRDKQREGASRKQLLTHWLATTTTKKLHWRQTGGLPLPVMSSWIRETF